MGPPMPQELPSPDLLRKILRYEPDTGKLFWLPRPVEMFRDGYHSADHMCRSWNSKLAGKEAFTIVTPAGYRKGTIFDTKILAHRVIWAMQVGAWPKREIDHIDGVPSNNVWGNLREATRAENQMNTGLYPNNTSGFRGVYWNKRKGKWSAEIKANTVRTFLGYFDNISDAGAAYVAARAVLHGEFARLS